jgi:hypothetical protein
MKRSSKIVLVCIGVLLLSLWYYWGKVMDKNISKEYDQFFNSNLNGIIEKVSIKYHGSSFSLKGNNKEYVFYPYTDERLNNGKVFENFANKGDSILKPSQSDTLILVKQTKVYKYTFHKEP